MEKLFYYYIFIYKIYGLLIEFVEKLIEMVLVFMLKVYFINLGLEVNDMVIKLIWYCLNVFG